jgi:hypothetical protein
MESLELFVQPLKPLFFPALHELQRYNLRWVRRPGYAMVSGEPSA